MAEEQEPPVKDKEKPEYPINESLSSEATLDNLEKFMEKCSHSLQSKTKKCQLDWGFGYNEKWDWNQETGQLIFSNPNNQVMRASFCKEKKIPAKSQKKHSIFLIRSFPKQMLVIFNMYGPPHRIIFIPIEYMGMGMG